MARYRWSRALRGTRYERGCGRHKTDLTMLILSDRHEKQRHGHVAKVCLEIYVDSRWRWRGKLGVTGRTCGWQDP